MLSIILKNGFNVSLQIQVTSPSDQFVRLVRYELSKIQKETFTEKRKNRILIHLNMIDQLFLM